jgi:hypothetical protein
VDATKIAKRFEETHKVKRRIYFFKRLCRAYGAHNSMNTLPTALPWANLPVRLRRVELPALLQ